MSFPQGFRTCLTQLALFIARSVAFVSLCSLAIWIKSHYRICSTLVKDTLREWIEKKTVKTNIAGTAFLYFGFATSSCHPSTHRNQRYAHKKANMASVQCAAISDVESYAAKPLYYPTSAHLLTSSQLAYSSASPYTSPSLSFASWPPPSASPTQQTTNPFPRTHSNSMSANASYGLAVPNWTLPPTAASSSRAPAGSPSYRAPHSDYSANSATPIHHAQTLPASPTSSSRSPSAASQVRRPEVNTWGTEKLYVSPPPSLLVQEDAIKQEPTEHDGFIMELAARPPSPISQALVPPTEVPLRATHATKEMRRMMGSFRANPFTLQSSSKDKDKERDSNINYLGEAVGPLTEEPLIFEFQLEVEGVYPDASGSSSEEDSDAEARADSQRDTVMFILDDTSKMERFDEEEYPEYFEHDAPAMWNYAAAHGPGGYQVSPPNTASSSGSSSSDVRHAHTHSAVPQTLGKRHSLLPSFPAPHTNCHAFSLQHPSPALRTTGPSNPRVSPLRHPRLRCQAPPPLPLLRLPHTRPRTAGPSGLCPSARPRSLLRSTRTVQATATATASGTRRRCTRPTLRICIRTQARARARARPSSRRAKLT